MPGAPFGLPHNTVPETVSFTKLWPGPTCKHIPVFASCLLPVGLPVCFPIMRLCGISRVFKPVELFWRKVLTGVEPSLDTP